MDNSYSQPHLSNSSNEKLVNLKVLPKLMKLQHLNQDNQLDNQLACNNPLRDLMQSGDKWEKQRNIEAQLGNLIDKQDLSDSQSNPVRKMLRSSNENNFTRKSQQPQSLRVKKMNFKPIKIEEQVGRRKNTVTPLIVSSESQSNQQQGQHENKQRSFIQTLSYNKRIVIGKKVKQYMQKFKYEKDPAIQRVCKQFGYNKQLIQNWYEWSNVGQKIKINLGKPFNLQKLSEGLQKYSQLMKLILQAKYQNSLNDFNNKNKQSLNSLIMFMYVYLIGQLPSKNRYNILTGVLQNLNFTGSQIRSITSKTITPLNRNKKQRKKSKIGRKQSSRKVFGSRKNKRLKRSNIQMERSSSSEAQDNSPIPKKRGRKSKQTLQNARINQQHRKKQVQLSHNLEQNHKKILPIKQMQMPLDDQQAKQKYYKLVAYKIDTILRKKRQGVEPYVYSNQCEDLCLSLAQVHKIHNDYSQNTKNDRMMKKSNKNQMIQQKNLLEHEMERQKYYRRVAQKIDKQIDNKLKQIKKNIYQSQAIQLCLDRKQLQTIHENYGQYVLD